MPPIKTQVFCPQCRMPVSVTLEQLFDVTQDPNAKQRFLSGRFNLINCPNCRYQGQTSGILMYHDADKDLLMYYVPIELGLPQPEQEKIVGKLVNEVIAKLPQEKRKAYLLNPKPALTLQSMMDRILEADGVTKEMQDEQRAKVQLLQALLTASDEALPGLIQERDAEIDETILQLLTATGQSALQQGNEGAARRIAAIQQQIVAHSSVGQQVRQRQNDVESAVRELQALGQNLTRDKLLEMLLTTESKDKVAAYVSMTRGALDYAFFEVITRRIERAESDEKTRLTARRDFILQLTQELDEAAEAQLRATADFIKQLADQPDPEPIVRQNMEAIDDTFMAILQDHIEAAQKAKQDEAAAKLIRIYNTIVRLTQENAPPEVRFLNQLVSAPSQAEAEALIKQNINLVNNDLLNTMRYVVEQSRSQGQENLAARLEHLHDFALGEMMMRNWQQ